MRYRKVGEAQSKEEAIVEEVVHRIIDDSGAPEILPELLQRAEDDESNMSVFGWQYTPVGLEASRLAGDVAKYYSSPRKGSAVRQLISTMFSVRQTRSKALSWAFVLVVTTLFNAFAGAVTTYQHSWFLRAQQIMDAESFWVLLPAWVIFYWIDMGMDSLQRHSAWELRMALQRQLNFGLAHSLFSVDAFYRMQTVLTNASPETLLCEDAFILVRQLTGSFIEVMQTASGFVFTSWLLYTYHPRLLFASLTLTPIFLFVLTRAAPYTAEVAEVTISIRGALHFILSRVQSNAEEIAIMGGGASELHAAEYTLEKHRNSSRKECFRMATVDTSVAIVSIALYTPILYILAEDMIERGITLGESVLNFELCNTLIFGWTSVIKLIASAVWSEMMAERMLTLTGLSQGYRVASTARTLTPASDLSKAPKDLILMREGGLGKATVLELRDVEVRLDPSRDILFRNLSFRLAPGESMLVLGETGIGKSTLLRSIQGLWLSGSGLVHRCRKDLVTCVPQKPFMYQASLRENLLYPWVERCSYVRDSEIRAALQAVNLGEEFTPFSLDKSMAWHDILSLGQQQRFGFARALLRRDSQLVLLDEATSAMDMRNERLVYGVLKERFPCYISAAHRRSVQQYHTHVLQLQKATEGTARSTHTFALASDGNQGEAPPKEEAETVQAEGNGVHKEAASDGKAEEAPVGVPESERMLSGGPTIQPPRMMLTLMRRIFFDIVVPIMFRRSFWRQIRWTLIAFLLAYALYLATLGAFVFPMVELTRWSQTRMRAEFWLVVLNKACLVIPVTIFLAFTFKYTINYMQRIVVIELQLFFCRRYFEKNMFYRLTREGRVADPSGRFSQWDFRAIVEFYATILNLLSDFAVTFVTLRGLIREADVGGVGRSLKIVVGVVAVITAFFIWYFLPIHVAYTKWVFESTRLHESLVHVHGHSEAVALLHGCDIERRRSCLMLDKCLNAGEEFVWLRETWQPIINDAIMHRVTKVGLACAIFPWVLAGRFDTVSAVFLNTIGMKLAGCFMGFAYVIVGSPEGFGGMSRVWELAVEMYRLRDMAEREATYRPSGAGGILLEQDDSRDFNLQLKDVTVRAPTLLQVPPMLKGLSLELGREMKLVVTGKSGIGKTSLIRTIAGIWTGGSGTIVRASNARSFFIAQRPYTCIGTLRHQLLYPAVMRTDVTEERLEEVLHQVHLEHLLKSPGLGPATDEVNSADRWFTQLSLGEVQRLSFARLLLQDNLRVAFLDEATSALSPNTEAEMYTLLQKHISSYMSVAHRPEAQKFHSHILELSEGDAEGKACWRVLPMEDYWRETERPAPA